MNDILSADNYQSKHTKGQMCVMYPFIDSEQLGWSLVACIFVLGLPL